MTLPAILFGILLSSVYGTAFHLWKGGSFRRLLLLVVLSWIGFWIGHLLGFQLDWTFLAIGPLNAGMATVGSAVFLFVGNWLSQVEVRRQ